jgi:hypothetical protein
MHTSNAGVCSESCTRTNENTLATSIEAQDIINPHKLFYRQQSHKSEYQNDSHHHHHSKPPAPNATTHPPGHPLLAYCKQETRPLRLQTLPREPPPSPTKGRSSCFVQLWKSDAGSRFVVLAALHSMMLMPRVVVYENRGM